MKLLLLLLPSASTALLHARPGLAKVQVAPMAAPRTPAVCMDFRCSLGVPLTGRTLDAALKIRCDTSGADYAIYWTKYDDELRASGSFVNNPAVSGFVVESKKIVLDANGDGPVAKVKNTGSNFYVADISESSLKRKELALQSGLTQIAMIPFEDGVVEIGRQQPLWDGVPVCASMPKRTLRKAFEELGALYTIFWSLEGDEFKVIASYETREEIKRRKQLRGDDESFVKISRALTLSGNGDGPVATALRKREEVVVVFTGEEDYSDNGCSSMKRGAKAREHGICSIHFVPVDDPKSGKKGVLEYGVSTTGQLSQLTLDATLKMQAESAGAAYAIYWKKDYTNGVVEGTPYVAQWHRDELAKVGKKLSFAEVSQAVKYDMLGESPVANVIRNRKQMFVPDVKAALNSDRSKIAEEYMIDAAAFVPVLGGVIEFGSSVSRPWVNGEAEAFKQIMPNEEIEKALRSGATYMMYWDRDDQAATYKQKATFEIPKNRLSLKDGMDKSFISECSETVLDANGLGPIGACGRAAATVVVPNTATYPNFKRRELAQEWGVGKITCVPLESGVLEFGTVTKDKRETTIGSEYQEVTRPYRRTVFMHDDWVAHRSTDRFFKSMNTILESGVLRARNRELGYSVAAAAFLCAWNALAGGYADFDNVKHGAVIQHLPVLSVPLSIFSLTAPSLGLLLVFKTNAAYGRWDNARRVWGDIINKCRSIVRQGNTFFVEDRYPGYGNFRDYRRRVAAETSAFTRCLRCFLRGKEDEKNLQIELKDLGFTQSEVAGYMKAANKQVYALQKIGETIRQYDMSPMDRANMDKVLTELCDDVGACERIFKTPIPLVYSRHTARFVGSWLVLLPLALYGVDSSWNHLASIPSAAVIVFFLLGIEELGSQLEEPFGILPMEAFCDGSIGAALQEMVNSEDAARALERQIASTPEAAPVAAPAAAPVVAVEKPAGKGVITPLAPVAGVVEEKKEGLRAKIARSLGK